MTGPFSSEVEEVIRTHCEAGDHRSATAALLEAYGPQILRFLYSRLRQEAATSDVFSMFCEDVWRGLPGFAWRSTVRAWAYTLARHAELRYRAAPERRPGRHLPLSSAPEVLALVDRVRTTTLPHLRTETKLALRALRERLAEDEQTILVLRVDKGMSWTEIACVLSDPEHSGLEPDGREIARLRKRFQLIKDKLRKWAEADGLVGPASSSG